MHKRTAILLIIHIDNTYIFLLTIFYQIAFIENSSQIARFLPWSIGIASAANAESNRSIYDPGMASLPSPRTIVGQNKTIKSGARPYLNWSDLTGPVQPLLREREFHHANGGSGTHGLNHTQTHGMISPCESFGTARPYLPGRRQISLGGGSGRPIRVAGRGISCRRVGRKKNQRQLVGGWGVSHGPPQGGPGPSLTLPSARRFRPSASR